MQEEVEQRTLTLVINGTKFSGRVLKSAVSKFVAFCRNQKAKKVNVHPKGKQSVKQLTRQGQGVNTMEIADENLRQFERIARKYGVDYAVRRDKDAEPPRFLLFFKGRDADAISAAFKEFLSTKERKSERPSVLQKLRELVPVAGAQKEKKRELER
mgnify:CR=1 FL=1